MIKSERMNLKFLEQKDMRPFSCLSDQSPIIRQITAIILLFLVNPLLAKEAISFKKELVSTIHWFPYGLVLSTLIIAVIILAKNSKKEINTHSHCKIIEKIAVYHKTKIYIIDYQGKKFLVADNQNSLAIQALQERPQL